MSPGPPSDRTARIQKEIEVRLQKALDNGMKGSSVEELGRLKLMLELAESLTPPRKRSLWPSLVIVVSALLLVAVLVSFRLRSTEVELVTQVSGFSAMFGANRKLLELSEATSLEITGASRLQVPDARGLPMELGTGMEPALSLMAQTRSGGTTTSRLILNPISVPASTRVAVRAPSFKAVSLSFGDPSSEKGPSDSIEIKADYVGPLGMTIPNVGMELPAAAEDSPSTLLVWGGRLLHVDVQADQPIRCIVCTPTPVSELSFESSDELRTQAATTVAPFSTISSGTLILRELGEQELSLRMGSLLTMDIEDGVLHSVSLDEKGGMTLIFRGKVRELALGAGSSLRPLKPTLLEWIRANRSLELTWTSLCFLVALSFSLTRFFSERK